MADKDTILNTCTILEDIERIFKEKGPFCSEEEFRYWFLSKNRAALNGNNNYSLEYPFRYYKDHKAHIDEEKDKDNAKVDAILWDPENPNQGLYAFEFKYAHKEFKSHGKSINDQTPTVSVRYDFLEDIDRLESLLDNNSDIHVNVGYAIFLTDKEAYRAQPREGANYYNIRLSDEKPPRTFDSNTEYMSTRKDGKITEKYHNPIIFRSTYKIEWEPIDGTKFYCCIVEVKHKDE